MLFVDGFLVIKLIRTVAAPFQIVQEELDIIKQLALVIFQSQDIVRPLLHNDLGNLRLTPHRIYGHNTPRYLQRPQELGNGPNLIGFVIHFDLPQH